MEVGWIFSIAIVCLGLSAAVFGRWMEAAGPRKAMLASALCFGSGFFVAALGLGLHILPLVYLGYGVLGGIGLGIGYISPVSTLIQWFPDRPGMATGLAIMGFGGGALIAAPLEDTLMKHFASGTDTGVVQTFFVLGALHLCAMMFSVFYVFVPIAAGLGSIGLVISSAVLIISMFGGGFSTIPAYLRDLFGTLQVGAIYGRLLTACSCLASSATCWSGPSPRSNMPRKINFPC